MKPKAKLATAQVHQGQLENVLSSRVSFDVPDNVSAVLHINLDSMVANYRMMQKLSGEAECAAVVKANAYGIGDREVVRALVKQGCQTFFVANLQEAIRVRRTSRKPVIYVLDGFHPMSEDAYVKHRLRPVLNCLDDVRAWNDFAKSLGSKSLGSKSPGSKSQGSKSGEAKSQGVKSSASKLKGYIPSAALQLDTGMNRLGLPDYEITSLASNPDYMEHFDLALILSHLACADDPTHPLNRLQKSLFDHYLDKLPKIRSSLANSAGVTLGAEYHCELTRPGIALYGGEPSMTILLGLKPVVSLYARILQIHDAKEGESVGYGASHTLTKPKRIATLSAGYADGIFRILGSSLSDGPSFACFRGQQVPILGRISMDLITCDFTDIAPDECAKGDWVELIGKTNTVNDVAKRARTSAYEILTALGPRYHRIYTQGKS